jgi:hypothetical protein
MRLFFSVSPADRVTALALQHALRTLLPEVGWEFWDDSRSASNERRTDAQAWLESARMAVVVHSPDYAATPDENWEKNAILQEKNRRRDGLTVAVVQARHHVMPPDLAGFECLPHADEAIEGPNGDRLLKQAAHALARLLRGEAGLLPYASGSSSEGQHRTHEDRTPPPITLSDLRERLLELADRNNLGDVLEVLHGIVHDADLLRRVLALKDEFVGAHLRERLQLADYQEKIKNIRCRTEQLIGELTEERLLHLGWPSVFLEMYRTSSQRETFPFFLPGEDIQIPETLNLPVTTDDAGSAERVGLLSYEQKLEFRRLLLLAQDALAVEKYSLAHAHAEQVRTKIDPQSAQLYEMLLVSFVKNENPNRIMHRLMEGIKSGFNHVKLYSDRFELYQNGQPQRCPTQTGRHNRLVAIEELGAGLEREYQALTPHAILDTGARAGDPAETRKRVLQCLEALFLLYQSLLPTKVLVEPMILEIIGGGKCHWLERMELRDGVWQFVGNADFDIEGKIGELLDLLRRADRRRPPEKQREMLREDLFFRLFAACHSLAEQVSEERRQHHVRTDVRRSVIRVIEACVLGHTLLTEAGDVLEVRKSLLRLAVELLLPGLLAETDVMDIPESVNLDWFDLDDLGELRNAAVCADYDFDALTVLQKIIHDMAGQTGWLKTYPNVKEEVWKTYVAETDAAYEAVRTGLQYDNFQRMDDLEARRRVVHCLRRWQVCYRAYPERGFVFLEKMLHELAGNELLMWFIINPLAIQNHPDSLAYGYDAERELASLRTLPDTWTDERVTQTVVGNLYRRYLLPEYEAVPRRDESKRGRLAELLGAMLLAFQKHPVPLYLDLVYRELSAETKLKWIDINRRGQWVNFGSAFDATDVLRQLTAQLPLRFDPLATRRAIADRRWEEQTLRYTTEISEIRHENRLPERKIAADIIWRLKGTYLFYPDLKYLELPLLELQGLGRIRWFARALGIFATNSNHFENVLVPFDLRAERVELEMYRVSVAQLFRQMLIELGLASDAPEAATANATF